MGRRPNTRDTSESKTISMERLKAVASYDPESGHFIRPSGKRAGFRSGRGYRIIQIDGLNFYEHRLAWFWATGEWPEQVDHINLSKTDNRICNLRASLKSENMRNVPARKHSLSGIKGARWDEQRKKWRSSCSVNGKSVYLGRFDTAEEANAAYMAKAQQLVGGFARKA